MALAGGGLRYLLLAISTTPYFSQKAAKRFKTAGTADLALYSTGCCVLA